MQKENKLPTQPFNQETEEEQTGVNAADAGQENTESRGKGKKSWEEILSDPEYRREYDRQVQGIIKKRLRDRQGNEERLRKLAAAMEDIGRSLGLDRPEGREPDAAQLAERIRRDRQERLKNEFARAAQAKSRLDSLKLQAEELKKMVPDFDLGREMEDEKFLKLTAPHTGLSLEDAYYARHHRELGEKLAMAGLISAAKAVSSGAARPRELRGGQEALNSSGDPRQMSRQEREALKRRIYQASAQGKKLPYGS